MIRSNHNVNNITACRAWWIACCTKLSFAPNWHGTQHEPWLSSRPASHSLAGIGKYGAFCHTGISGNFHADQRKLQFGSRKSPASAVLFQHLRMGWPVPPSPNVIDSMLRSRRSSPVSSFLSDHLPHLRNRSISAGCYTKNGQRIR